VFLFLGSVWEAPGAYIGNSPEISSAFGKTNMVKQADRVYQSFLVRCWLMPPATAAEPETWRFELREVAAEPQKHGFSDLEQLKAFMAVKLTAVAAGSKQHSDKEENRKGEKP
jgi:hypothetical protein